MADGYNQPGREYFLFLRGVEELEKDSGTPLLPVKRVLRVVVGG